MTLPDLLARLDDIHRGGGIAKAIVLMQTDAGTPAGVERELLVLDNASEDGEGLPGGLCRQADPFRGAAR